MSWPLCEHQSRPPEAQLNGVWRTEPAKAVVCKPLGQLPAAAAVNSSVQAASGLSEDADFGNGSPEQRQRVAAQRLVQHGWTQPG